MKAAWFGRFGAARDVLEVGHLPDPVPGPGEVLVRVATSGVNPSDAKKRAGAFPDLLAGGPVVPHSDGAGTIEAIGEGVDPTRVGERVWVYQAQHGRRLGTAAELLAIDAARAVPLPANTSFEHGACLGIPAMTAHRCVFADGPVTGQRVLVTGGAGRVGQQAIRWAARDGAAVVATASHEADRASCLAAGAVAVVDHRQAGWGEAVLDATGGGRMDRVVEVEFGGNLPEVLTCIRTGGTIAAYASMQVREPVIPFYRVLYMDLTIRIVIVYDMPEAAKRAAAEAITIALEGKELDPRVAHVVALDDIARGHELIEQGGFRGCVVVRLP